MSEQCVAILGRRDEPTDAVEEYCQYLGKALSKHEIDLEITRVPWAEFGWSESLKRLRKRMRESQANWALVQYTTLSWSRRGFPLQILRVMREIKRSGKRCTVVFHDAAQYPGERLVDRVRRRVQLYAMRGAAQRADLVVLTIPREKIAWLPKKMGKTVFIPVGANLPDPEAAWELREKETREKPTIAVFSITGGAAGQNEVEQIAKAVSFASEKVGALRVSVFGRHAEVGGKNLQERLAGSRVEVVVQGLLRAEEIVRVLGRSDVLLFVRGPISSRRGSALAGIACGLPVIAYRGPETAPPVTEAGVIQLHEKSGSEAGQALVRVLTDEAFRRELRKRSQRAQSLYFSWDVIAAQYAAALGGTGSKG